LWCRSLGEDGITLTSAPVSAIKRVPEAKSWIKKRRLEGWPGSLIAASNWPGCFLLGARRSALAGTITEPKVIPAKVGRSAGTGGAGVVGGMG